MAIKSQQVSVGLAAVSLTVQDTGTGQGQVGESVAVLNPSTSVTVYLGGTTVTTASGYGLAPGASLAVDLAPGEGLYAIVAATTTSVHCLYQGA